MDTYEFLTERKNELVELESKIKNYKKNKIKRNLAISANIIRLIMPYIIAPCISIGTLKLCGAGYPFYIDKEEREKCVKKQIDSKGNILLYEQCMEFDNMVTTFNYYSKWIKKDSIYERRVDTYQFSNLNDEYIYKLINKDNIDIDDIIGEKVSTRFERKNAINLNELNNSEYIEALIYYKSTDEFVVVEEDVITNIRDTILHCVFLVYIEMLTNKLRNLSSKYNYEEEIDKIYEMYVTTDLDKLKKKYEIRKSNYKRLVKKYE